MRYLEYDIIKDLSLNRLNQELKRELEILKTAFKNMKKDIKISWKEIKPSNGKILIEHNFFDHVCYNSIEKELKRMYFHGVNKEYKFSEDSRGRGLLHDTIFSLVFLKEVSNNNTVILEPEYVVDNNKIRSPDMIIENDIKYSIEIKGNKKGIKKAARQIGNSFVFDCCDFGICIFPDKKIKKITKINNLKSVCFLSGDTFSDLEDLGLEKLKEKKLCDFNVVLIDYAEIKNFFETNLF